MAARDPLGSAPVRRRRPTRTGRVGRSLAHALIGALLSSAQEASDAWRESWEAAEARIEVSASLDEIAEIVAVYEARVDGESAAWVVHRGVQRLLELRADASEDERLELTERLWRARMELAEPEKALTEVLDLARRRIARGEDGRARVVLEESLRRLPEAHGYRPYLLQPLADLERRQLRWSAALAHVDEAEAILAAPPGSAPIACALRLLRGQVALDMGLLERAEPLIEEGLAAAEALRAAGATDASALATGWVLRANLRLATRRLARMIDEAEHVLAREDEVLSQRPATRGELLVRTGMARADLALDDPTQVEPARAALMEALEDPGARSLTRLSAEGLLAQLALQQGDALDASRWIEAASARLEEGRFAPGEHAFVSALAARFALDAAPADLDAARERLAADVERLLAEWRDQPVRTGGLGHLQFERARLPIAEAMALALRRDPGERGLAAGLDLLVRAQGVGSLARSLDARETSWEEARAVLVPPDGGLLVYFPSIGAGHVFAADGAGVVHAALPDRRRLVPRVQELAGLLHRLPAAGDDADERARRRTDIEQLTTDLGRELFPPAIAARLERWRAVTVVGAELLEELPFESLRLPSGASLGETLAVAHLSSLPVGVALARRAGERGAPHFARDLCLVADASPSAAVQARHPEVRALDLDARERDALTRAFATERTLFLTGAAASVTALAAGAADARVLHVLAHGVWDPLRERPAALVLAPDSDHADGLLFADDAERIAAPPLVVLTACESGVEPQRRGDAGAASLTGGFFRGGADTVVHAVSALSTRGAIAMMERFQVELAGGASPAEALRRARVALRANPAWDDPAYTDLVRVSGLGHAPVFEAVGDGTHESWAVPTSLGALALIAIILARWRRRR